MSTAGAGVAGIAGGLLAHLLGAVDPTTFSPQVSLTLFAAVLIVAGAELLAMGLLAEMNVRYYHEPARKVPYAVELVLRSKDGEQSVTSD